MKKLFSPYISKYNSADFLALSYLFEAINAEISPWVHPERHITPSEYFSRFACYLKLFVQDIRSFLKSDVIVIKIEKRKGNEQGKIRPPTCTYTKIAYLQALHLADR